MSEPRAKARRIEAVFPDLLHWTVYDDRIDYRSDAYAVVSSEGTVLVDPVPLVQDLLPRLGRVTAIVITGGFHQRSAWRLRGRFGARVWAPATARGLEDVPDREYEPDDLLPGALRALHAPGPAHVHFALMLERPDERAALFTGDLLIRRSGDDEFRFVPDKLQENPGRTRETLRELLEIDADAILPAHGEPLAHGAAQAMASSLSRDAAR
jgi:glyoxylase-like metal-dependent hydrolase (beta-lactamase superfamily II)